MYTANKTTCARKNDAVNNPVNLTGKAYFTNSVSWSDPNATTPARLQAENAPALSYADRRPHVMRSPGALDQQEFADILER